MCIYKDHNGLDVIAFDSKELTLAANNYIVKAPNGFETQIAFQAGSPSIFGINGITNESMLAILIYRTEQLNANFACGENEIALYHMREALKALESRTNKRIERGVESQHIV